MSPLRGYSTLLQFWHFNKGIIIIIFGHRARISASSGRRVVSFCCRLSFSSVLFQLDFVFSHTWEMSPPPRTSMTDEIISFALDLCPAHCRRFLSSSSAITQHNFTALHSQLVRCIRGIRRFYPANEGIWIDESELNCIYSRSEALFLGYNTPISLRLLRIFSDSDRLTRFVLIR